MKYLHSMIRVTDLDKSMQFFCEVLGMTEIKRMESESGRFTLVFLAASEDVEAAKEENAPVVELTYNWPDENSTAEELTDGRSFGHLAYSVKNIYETCRHLVDSGITINRPPRDGYMAFFKTPDGISIELLQQGARLEPHEPWASMGNTGSW